MNERGEVTAWIARAARRARAFVGVEALGVAAAAGLCVANSAVLSGARADDGAVIAVALLAGVACGAMWFLERRRSALELAQRADRKLELRGSLTTAYESESAERAGALARVLAARVASSLSKPALDKAVPAPSPVFAAAPLIAAAALALVLQVQPRPSSAELALLTRVAGAATSAARAAETSGADSEQVERVVAGAQRVAQLAQAATLEHDEIASAVAELDAALDELAAASPSEIAELRAARDLAQHALRGAAEQSGEHGGSAGSRANGSSSAVAKRADVSTMSRPRDRAETPMTPPNSAPDARNAANPAISEPGTSAGRWWDARYDAVVAEFLARGARTETDERR